MRLLLTRPREDSDRSAAALRALGHEVLIVPVLRVEAIADADLGPGPWAAAIMTSANAARAIVRHPRHAELTGLPLFAVGRRTAEAAVTAGFADVVSADGDGRDLAGLIAARAPDRAAPLLYLAGEDRAPALETALAAEGFSVRTGIVYRAVVDPGFATNLTAAAQGRPIDGVLHYSRRSAAAFRAAVTGTNALNCRHYCLSRQVAEPLRDETLGPVAVAARPDEAALFALLDRI
jgi:uroporphyrinogen-III synthase